MRAADIQIPEPCHEDWDAMTPLQRGRHCDTCRQTVHDLSTMTEREAKRLLNSGEEVCISYRENDDGSVKLRPAPVVPLAALTRRLPRVAAAGLSIALAACAPHGEGPSLETQHEEPPAFLEYTPSIPEAEPCDAPPLPAWEEPPALETPPPAEVVDAPRRPPRMGRPVLRKKGKLKRLPLDDL